MVLAFRLYGHFHWPPHPDIDDLAANMAPGVVEVHYREKGITGVFRPILRWTPQDKFLSGAPLPEIHASLFDFSTKQAVDWFNENAGNDCAIWIDAGAHDSDRDWVAFRGAFLFEQHRAADPSQQEALDLCWPLVRTSQYAPGKAVHSSLDVGRRGGPRFCLNLHLPLPARRATLLPATQVDPSAFPFTAVYEPGSGDFEKILQFSTLLGGWIEGDAVDTSATPVSQTSFVFSDSKYPSGSPAHLRHFKTLTLTLSHASAPTKGGLVQHTISVDLANSEEKFAVAMEPLMERSGPDAKLSYRSTVLMSDGEMVPNVCPAPLDVQGLLAADNNDPGFFVSLVADGDPGAGEFWTDVSLLHSPRPTFDGRFDFDWLFSRPGGEEPALDVAPRGLNAMVEAQARVIAVSPPIPIQPQSADK